MTEIYLYKAIHEDGNMVEWMLTPEGLESGFENPYWEIHIVSMDITNDVPVQVV